MKTFCPSCERETNCVYVAELYECKECGCDFESRQRLMQERAEAAEARLAERAAEVARLTAALAAANEDAERLASVLEDDGYPVKRLPMNAKRLSLAAHRARMGVSRDEGK